MMGKRFLSKFRPAIVSPIPGGILPDAQGMWGHFMLAQQVNAALPNDITTLSSQNTLIGLSPAELISGALILDSAQGGAVTVTSPSGPGIISFFGPTIPTDGTFASRVRVLNSTSQTVTLAGSTGVATRGTMTIATGSYRDLLLLVGSSSTVSIRNAGGGTI